MTGAPLPSVAYRYSDMELGVDVELSSDALRIQTWTLFRVITCEPVTKDCASQVLPWVVCHAPLYNAP